MSVGLFPFNEVEKIKIKTKLIHSIVFTRAEAEQSLISFRAGPAEPKGFD
jgi:hypothetical protein